MTPTPALRADPPHKGAGIAFAQASPMKVAASAASKASTMPCSGTMPLATSPSA